MLKADSTDTERDLRYTWATVESFSPKHVWNVDQFVPFYCQPLGRFLTTSSVSGYKNDKNSVTGVPSCNSYELERFLLMMIGGALQPSPFKRNDGNNLRFDYSTN